MSQSVNAVLEPAARASGMATPVWATTAAGLSLRDITLSLHDDMAAVETEWRRFEQHADCTVFQSFDWLSLWCRHIGGPADVRPAIVAGRDKAGALLFLMPLAVAPGLLRRLTFLGDGLCDYNAPLLAPGFSAALEASSFRALWRDIGVLVRSRPHLRHDVIALTKMPEAVGAQANPFLHLNVGLNPSGAHLMALGSAWEAFYTAKRSSATRRRDRSKRKHLAEHGELRFANPARTDETTRTLNRLMEQKAKSFVRMGVQNLFERPGHRDFFHDLAVNPRTRDLVHISRLDVGDTWAAVNLALTFRGTYYHVLASYDDGELSRFGPGAAHLRDLLQYAIERGFTCFDFTIGDERYKLEWSDMVLRLFDHSAAATLRGWPVVFVVTAVRRLKRLIKQNPVLWRLFSLVRAAGASWGGRARSDEAATGGDSPPIAPH